MREHLLQARLLVTLFYFLLHLHLASLKPESSEHSCSDDLYQDCKERAARGECQASDQDVIIRTMLSQCRQTCSKLWQGTSPPDFLAKYGGLGDSIRDSFGFDHHLCGPSGLTSEGRASLLLYQARNSEQVHWVPRFTENGFQKVQIPAELWEPLSAYYNKMIPTMVEVTYKSRHIDNRQQVEDNGDKSFLRPVSPLFEMEFDSQLLEQVKRVLKPLAEAWSGLLLDFVSTSNVRRYTNGSVVAAHLDGIGHLVIGAIMNMGQEVEEDWPLYVKDHQGGDHQVLLKPGEMLWFESARLVHGRLKPLNGKFYDNLFVYFKPRGAWYTDIPPPWVFQIGKMPRKEGPLTKEMIVASQMKHK